MKLISIIIPAYNEEQNIPVVYQQVSLTLQTLAPTYDYEFIFINDGSKDHTWEKINDLAQTDAHVKGINFSRNFGHQIALSAGYDVAKGDAIISMDADLQDPPTLLLEMINAWEKGFDIVYARRINRDDGFLKKLTALWYYKFLDAVAEVKIPRNVGDFRLIDKKVLNELKRCREKSRYLRGMVAWTGFKHTFVDFVRPNRLSGMTGYTWKKMFRLAFDGLTGFSLFPLKIAAYVGVFVIITGAAMFCGITIDAFIKGVHYPLFKWLVTIIYIFMGVLFLLLWLIGEYIGRIYEQQKDRPLYIVEERVNL
jgi:glycosyltransferase involved in cell wall biosynthesis